MVAGDGDRWSPLYNFLSSFKKQSGATRPAKFAIGDDGYVAALQHGLKDFSGDVGLIDEQLKLGKLVRVDGELGHGHGDQAAVLDEPLIRLADRAEIG